MKLPERINAGLKIYVISHKTFCMPMEDPLYQPLIVGQNEVENSDGCLFDHTGDHISEKNGRYNELTGMYWVWKNVQEDVVGICHYRRYFVTPAGKLKNLLIGRQDCFLDERHISKMLKQSDIIVHNKTFFRENNRIQFSKGVNPVYWEFIEREMRFMYPSYHSALRTVAGRRYAHLLNMLITKKEVYDQYCEWLFPLLFRIENQLKSSGRVKNMNRSMGMIGERLLDVWLFQNRLKLKECFSINTEKKDWKAW